MSETSPGRVALVSISGHTMLVPQLRRLRLEQAYSQVELARRAGVSRATVMKAEGGRQIRPVSVRRLAKALGVRPRILQVSQSSSS